MRRIKKITIMNRKFKQRWHPIINPNEPLLDAHYCVVYKTKGFLTFAGQPSWNLVSLNSVLVCCLKFVLLVLDKQSQCVGTRLCNRSRLSCELTASQLVDSATRSHTGSHNRLDLIQSIVLTHYVCNGYIYI